MRDDPKRPIKLWDQNVLGGIHFSRVFCVFSKEHSSCFYTPIQKRNQAELLKYYRVATCNVWGFPLWAWSMCSPFTIQTTTVVKRLPLANLFLCKKYSIEVWNNQSWYLHELIINVFPLYFSIKVTFNWLTVPS